MKNEETNQTVEGTLIGINERVEETNREAEEHSNKLAKIANGLVIADRALSVIGFGLVVGAVIKESMK